MAHDFSKIENQLKTLDGLLADLNSKKLRETLLEIIRHKPGWTTPAELKFVENALQALTHGLEGQLRQSSELIETARMVKPTGAASTAA